MGKKLKTTITLKEWNAASLEQRGIWLDERVKLDKEGMKVLTKRLEKEKDKVI